MSGKGRCVDKRIECTVEYISCWFTNWEFNLVDLGFAMRGADGTVTIPDEQLYYIINFNETCLSLDGSEGQREGCPQITLHDPQQGLTDCYFGVRQKCCRRGPPAAFPVPDEGNNR